MRTPTKVAHLHFVEPGAQAIRDYLDLRDWLRRHVDDREEYEAVKRALAGRQWEDMN
jgi:GrpB-like predicted nucleotidyltransferase (UPF0157 family)